MDDIHHVRDDCEICLKNCGDEADDLIGDCHGLSDGFGFHAFHGLSGHYVPFAPGALFLVRLHGARIRARVAGGRILFRVRRGTVKLVPKIGKAFAEVGD